MKGRPLYAAQLREFERLHAQLGALQKELNSLSAREPEAPYKALSAFKVKVINTILEKAVLFFGREPPLHGVTRLTEENPNNSDASIVVSQYLAALDAFRSAHVARRYGKSFWVLHSLADEEEPDESRDNLNYVPVEGAPAPEES